jgi:hypothetical protein
VTTFKTAESPYKSDNTASNMCGFTLTIMFANPEDAAEYLGFDLTPTSA